MYQSDLYLPLLITKLNHTGNPYLHHLFYPTCITLHFISLILPAPSSHTSRHTHPSQPFLPLPGGSRIPTLRSHSRQVLRSHPCQSLQFVPIHVCQPTSFLLPALSYTSPLSPLVPILLQSVFIHIQLISTFLTLHSHPAL